MSRPKFMMPDEQVTLVTIQAEIAALRDNLTWTLHELKTSADRLTECEQTTLSARDCINRVEAALAKEEGK